MWILQYIPADFQAKIICSGKAFGFKPTKNDETEIKRKNRQIAKAKLLTAWGEISSQTPPSTLVVIHNSVYEGTKDEFHDRYIVRGRAIWWSKSEINWGMRRKKNGLLSRSPFFYL
jgi:hypothetical protein